MARRGKENPKKATGKNATEKSFHIIHSFSLLFSGKQGNLVFPHCPLPRVKNVFLLLFLFIYFFEFLPSFPPCSVFLLFFFCLVELLGAQANEIYVRTLSELAAFSFSAHFVDF